MERCRYCGEGFARPFTLRRHVQRRRNAGDSRHGGQAQAQPGRAEIVRREPELRRTEIARRGPFPALAMAPGEAIRRSAEPMPERARLWLQYGWLKAMQVKIEKGLASGAECEQYLQGEAEYLSAISGRRVALKTASADVAPVMHEAQATAKQAEDRSLWFFLSG